MGAAAPTDGKRVLSAAGSPEGSRPFGKVSPLAGGGSFRGNYHTLYCRLQITTAIQFRPQAPVDLRVRGKREKGATRHMASVTKFTQGAVFNQLRHNLRQIAHSGNPDIDPLRLRQDYVLSPDRGMSDYDYFRERLSQLYVYGRNDVKVMAGWVVTAPQDLEQEQYDDFFLAVYDFLENRYGEENVVQAVVHDDEGGQPHLHFCFIPVVEDKKHEEGYKVCANDVLDRRELRNFHPDLQRFLDEHGLEDACVMTGVTRAQGGNRTVAELKAEREREYEQEIERPEFDFGGSGVEVEQELHF